VDLDVFDDNKGAQLRQVCCNSSRVERHCVRPKQLNLKTRTAWLFQLWCSEIRVAARLGTSCTTACTFLFFPQF
jgi:hypothetical protein